MSWRGTWVAVLVTSAALLAACNGSGGGSDSYGERDAVELSGTSVTVEIKDIKFQPQGIKIQPGTTVTWVNKDPVIHNVRQVESVFLSQDEMEERDTFSFTFDTPGTYRYVCTFHHPNQLGVVIVEEN
jgi:plastocyanin